MPGITIHDNDSPFKGAVKFANEAVKTFVEDNKNKTEPKHVHLREMMQRDLYITDVRAATNPSSKKINEKNNQIDLVGFNKKGETVAFTILTDHNVNVQGFAEQALNKMSAATQEMAQDIRARSGLDQDSGYNP